MVTGSTPTSAAGVLAVLLGDGDFDEVAEIIGAWAAARPSLRLPRQAGGVPRIPRRGRPRGGGSPRAAVAA
jgi:hypothetical protein